MNRSSYVRPSADSAQINVFVQSSGTATVVASGTGIPSTTLTRDAATGRFFAPITPNNASSLPAFIRFTATAPGAQPSVLDKELVDEVGVTNATFDENSNTLTVQAASSDQLAPAPTLEARDSIGALGVLQNGNLTHPMPVPAAQVIVSSSAGGVATVPVTLIKRVPVATTTALAVSPNPAFRNQSVTLTATVSASTGINSPTGSVTFKAGTATLGTATLNTSGQATFTVAANTLAAATHALSAEYAGVATFFLASVSPQVNLLVQLASTTTSLSASATAIATNQTVTLTATVSPLGAGGTVTFRDGGANLATANVNASGVATLTVPAGTFSGSAAGVTHALSAVYGGNATFATSTSAVVNLLVTTPVAAATTTSLSASASTIASNQPVTLTATVTPNPGSGGSVAFRNGTTTLGTATLNAQGSASFTVAANTLTGSATGTAYALSAAFAGTPSFGASTSAALNLTVTAAPPPTAVATTTSAITATPTFLGGVRRVNAITLRVTVSSASGVPSGTVTLRDNTQNITLGTATLNAAGVGTVVVPANTFAPAGVLGTVHAIAATYSGSANHTTSSSTTNLRVFN